jgi:hypothetical protein
MALVWVETYYLYGFKLLHSFKQVGGHFNMMTNAHHNTNIKWGHSCQIKISMYSFLDFNIKDGIGQMKNKFDGWA